MILCEVYVYGPKPPSEFGERPISNIVQGINVFVLLRN
jgi:hypothetical protein